MTNINESGAGPALEQLRARSQATYQRSSSLLMTMRERGRESDSPLKRAAGHVLDRLQPYALENEHVVVDQTAVERLKQQLDEISLGEQEKLQVDEFVIAAAFMTAKRMITSGDFRGAADLIELCYINDLVTNEVADQLDEALVMPMVQHIDDQLHALAPVDLEDLLAFFNNDETQMEVRAYLNPIVAETSTSAYRDRVRRHDEEIIADRRIRKIVETETITPEMILETPGASPVELTARQRRLYRQWTDRLPVLGDYEPEVVVPLVEALAGKSIKEAYQMRIEGGLETVGELPSAQVTNLIEAIVEAGIGNDIDVPRL